MLANPLGPALIGRGLRNAAWPAYRSSAWLYRRTVLSRKRVVGVTGSFGKTTTTRAISTTLASPIAPGGNHSSGIALRVLRTPSDLSHIVLELGIDGPGQMRGYASMVRPDVAVLSGIGSEHGRSLGSLERTRDEKGELIRALPPDGTAILNADDQLATSVSGWTKARVVACGFHPDADVRILDHAVDWPQGNRLTVSVHGKEIEISTRLLGRQMMFPIAAALAAAESEGVDLETAKERLESMEPTPGRMEIIAIGNGIFLIHDAFKGAFETYGAAIDAIATVPAKRRLMVVGDIAEPPGKQADAYRSLGRNFAEVDNAWILHVGKETQRLQAGAKKAGFPAERIVGLGKDPLGALERIQEMLEPGDVVLLKGRDTQKFDRIELGLKGHSVGCRIEYCDKRGVRCDGCPLLESGWEGLPEFMGRRERGAG